MMILPWGLTAAYLPVTAACRDLVQVMQQLLLLSLEQLNAVRVLGRVDGCVAVEAANVHLDRTAQHTQHLSKRNQPNPSAVVNEKNKKMKKNSQYSTYWSQKVSPGSTYWSHDLGLYLICSIESRAYPVIQHQTAAHSNFEMPA